MTRPLSHRRPSVLVALSLVAGGLVSDRMLLAVTSCRSARSLAAVASRLRRLGYDVRRDRQGRGYYMPVPRG